MGWWSRRKLNDSWSSEQACLCTEVSWFPNQTEAHPSGYEVFLRKSNLRVIYREAIWQLKILGLLDFIFLLGLFRLFSLKIYLIYLFSQTSAALRTIFEAKWHLCSFLKRCLSTLPLDKRCPPSSTSSSYNYVNGNFFFLPKRKTFSRFRAQHEKKESAEMKKFACNLNFFLRDNPEVKK